MAGRGRKAAGPSAPARARAVRGGRYGDGELAGRKPHAGHQVRRVGSPPGDQTRCQVEHEERCPCPGRSQLHRRTSGGDQFQGGAQLASSWAGMPSGSTS